MLSKWLPAGYFAGFGDLIMIEIVSGSLGSGKSTYCAHETAAHTRRHGWVVAANFSPPRSWISRVPGHWITTTDVDDLYICAEMMAEVRKGVNDYPGLLILDDCHTLFNARDWNKNKGWIEFLSNSRKLGWRTLLVSHSDQMIDKQIRNFVEYHTHFRSLRKVFIPWIPFDIPIVPWPIPEQFLYVTRYYGAALGRGQVARRGIFGLASNLPYSSGTIFRSAGLAGEVKRYDSSRPTIFNRIFEKLHKKLFDRAQPQPESVECQRHIFYTDGKCIRCGCFSY